jgi:hypothetical protein
MKTKELSKRKRDNSHHREKNLTEETRDEREEKRRASLIIRPRNAKQKQGRSRKCFVTNHTSRGAALCAVHCLHE